MMMMMNDAVRAAGRKKVMGMMMHE